MAYRKVRQLVNLIEIKIELVLNPKLLPIMLLYQKTKLNMYLSTLIFTKHYVTLFNKRPKSIKEGPLINKRILIFY